MLFRSKHAERSRAFQEAYREQHGKTYAATHYPAQRRAASSRRRALFRGAPEIEKFEHAAVFERDGWLCGLCGGPVDPRIAHPDPRSPSLDHIVPLKKSGAHTLANVQLAHLGCNSSKGDRLAPR